MTLNVVTHARLKNALKTGLGQQSEARDGSSQVRPKLTTHGRQITVAKTPLVRTPLLWSNPKTLADHFNRHGADFAASTADDYIQQASRFFRKSQLENLPTKLDPNGVTRVYDAKTNTFGSFGPDGAIKTFYKPDPAIHKYRTNIDYWNAQKGTAP